MKRFCRILVLAAALAAVLAASALGANFTHCADALHDLGLFQGTDGGYDLDRAPSRAEAGAMLVRLLGAEDEALAMEAYTAPFTDVRDWAKPYVQYLYDHGLTNGTGADTYGASDPCTAQQYAAFLLRALGYTDGEGGDFAYADALDFAGQLGVVNPYTCDASNFLRDHVAAMSYTALATAPKSGEADLLTKLVAEGAIADARGIDRQFANYRDYAAAGAAMNSATAVSADMTMTMDLTLSDVPLASGDVSAEIAANADLAHLDQTELAMTMDLDMALNPAMAEAMGVSADEAALQATVSYYYTDGVYYMDMMGQKVRMPLSIEDLVAAFPAEVLEADAANLISLFTSVEAVQEDGAVRYRLAYACAPFNALYDALLSGLQAGSEMPALSLELGEFTEEAVVRDGAIVSSDVFLSMDMTVEGQTLSAAVVGNLDNIRTGDAVTVTLPEDLDTYQEFSGDAASVGIIGGADGPTSIVVS